MSRKRYISTKISLDKRVNQLAQQAGDFAALLYTWMIPHAEDDARLTGDPEEILMTVLPGRRDKSPEDIESALHHMQHLGLILWNRDEGYIEFPLEKFYTYQSYIGKDNRRTTGDTEQQQKTPENAGKKFNPVSSPENASSLSLSPSLSDPPSLSLSPSARVPAHARGDEERESSDKSGQDDDAQANASTPLQQKAIGQAIKKRWPDLVPKTPGDLVAWNAALKTLADARYTPQQIDMAIEVYERRFVNGIPSVAALVRHIGGLLSARASPMNGHGTGPRKPKRPEPTQEEIDATQRELLDALSRTGSE